jgi:hypothetical protein
MESNRGNIAGYVSNDFDIEIRLCICSNVKKRERGYPNKSLTKMSVIGKSGQSQSQSPFGRNPAHRKLLLLSVWRNKAV